MEKRSGEYRQFEQFGSANSQKTHKKQYHEVIGFPANSDQQQSYAPTYQWLPQIGVGVAENPAQQQGYAYTSTRQREPQAGVAQRHNQPQGYSPTQQRVPPAAVNQQSKASKPKPMPKARALALVSTMKKAIVVASLTTFVSFGGLAAFHQIGTTASKTTSVTSTSSQ